MEDELESLRGISDVSYLTTRLRLAKRKNETEIMKGIIQRLKETGLLKEEERFEGKEVKNLREYVNYILESRES